MNLRTYQGDNLSSYSLNGSVVLCSIIVRAYNSKIAIHGPVQPVATGIRQVCAHFVEANLSPIRATRNVQGVVETESKNGSVFGKEYVGPCGISVCAHHENRPDREKQQGVKRQYVDPRRSTATTAEGN